MSDSESPSEDSETEGSSLLGPAGASLRWVGRTVIGGNFILVGGLKAQSLQDGRQDILTATLVSIGLLGPIWIILGGLHLIGVRQNVLCSNGEIKVLLVPIAGLLELLVFAFILKGLLRLMIALSQADEKLANPLLSMVAAIIPLVIGSFFEVGNDSLLSCLYP